MIKKIKDLMQIRELIDEIKSSVSGQTAQISELKSSVVALSSELNVVKSNFSEFNQKHSEFFNTVSGVTSKITESKDDLIREINDFRLKKTQMQQKMMDSSGSELKQSLERVKTDVARYNDLKREIDSVNGKISKVSSEIDKFINISSSIDAKDFELKKFAKQLIEMDNEKLYLLKKIDTLERLCSKQRRMMR
ncbi:hypothetical protein ACFLYT_00900 [Nanoarchaeota archaeon]